MNIKEVYEKYKHLDSILIDKKFMESNNAPFIKAELLYEFWLAIKENK